MKMFGRLGVHDNDKLVHIEFAIVEDQLDKQSQHFLTNLS